MPATQIFSDLGHAANYLYMLDGRTPGAGRVKAVETYLVTLIDHSINASTFTARVIMSTQSDVVAAVAGAVGALKGPLHGGAPGPTLRMVLDIGSLDRVESCLRDRLARAAGWVSHCLEQQRANRLLQLQTLYTGPLGRRWVPMDERPAARL